MHDGEEVVSLEAFEHETLTRRGDGRVRALDEKHAHLRQLGAELVHVDLPPAA